MNKSERISRLIEFANSLFPNAKCELFYSKDYELAIAVMLSAQTTDKSVNQVTNVLFKKYPDIDSYISAPIEDIEETIKSIGLYKNKAKNIKGIALTLKEKFNYQLPSDKDLLQTLPGIGNKSAGVIRIEVFDIPDLPVDTHLIRVTKRLGIAKKDDEPIDIERILKKYILEENWKKTHHQLIHFGRYFCKAKKPNCEMCKLRDICNN